MPFFLPKKKPARVYPQPTDGRRQMMDHQLEGCFDYGEKFPNPAWFMEMRLGKCLTTIRWVQHRSPRFRRCLVVCPKLVLEAWERELELEGETFVRGYDVSGEKRMERVMDVDLTPEGERKWLLLNYEGVVAMLPPEVRRERAAKKKQGRAGKPPLPIIATLDWDLVLLDESTKIKNPQADITHIFCEGFRKFKHRAILTGLPSPEGELDLFQQFKFLDGHFMGCKNYWQFRDTHYEQGYDGWMPRVNCETAIKREVHKRAFVKTRKEAGIGSRKIYKELRVDMNATQRKLYNQIESDWAATVEVCQDPDLWTEFPQETKETQHVITQMLWLQMVCCGIDPNGNWVGSEKIKEVIKLLKGELKGQKVVLWYKFIASLKLNEEILRKEKVKTTHIIGEVDQKERARRLEEFRKSDCQVLLATEKVAKYGVDCSVADTAIYMENEWSCEDRGQSEDRIVHPKKQVPLLYIDMITRGTLEEDLVDTVKNVKLANARDFMRKFRQLHSQRKASHGKI